MWLGAGVNASALILIGVGAHSLGSVGSDVLLPMLQAQLSLSDQLQPHVYHPCQTKPNTIYMPNTTIDTDTVLIYRIAYKKRHCTAAPKQRATHKHQDSHAIDCTTNKYKKVKQLLLDTQARGTQPRNALHACSLAEATCTTHYTCCTETIMYTCLPVEP